MSIDETHEPYTGKFRKVIDWIFGYKQKRGETGNFRFLVFALVSLRQRIVLRVVPVKVGQDTKPIIIDTANKILVHVKYRAILMDRGFYKSELVKMLQDEALPFIIRAKIPSKIKRCFDFGEEADGELYDFQSIFVDLVRVRDIKGRKYGFLTNLQKEKWKYFLFWYAQRWNVENIFLACDKICLKTNSSKIELKYFCVVFSFLIYNLRSDKKIQLPLLKFCLNLINFILDNLKQFLKSVWKPPSLNLPGFSFIIKFIYS